MTMQVLHLKWNPDFSNPHFLNLLITQTKNRFPSSVKRCNFTPNFFNYPIFQTLNFSFPLEVRKIVIPLYIFFIGNMKKATKKHSKKQSRAQSLPASVSGGYRENSGLETE